VDLPETKLCTKCKLVLPRSAFSTQKQGKYLYPCCKKCKSTARVKYQQTRIALLPEDDNICRLYRCRGCGLLTGIHAFYRSIRRGSSEFCKKCFKVHRRKVRRNNLDSWHASMKLKRDSIKNLVRLAKNVPCLDCKRIFKPEQMDFDHVRGLKKFNLSVAYRKASSVAALYREFEKCDLICANCHRDRTQFLQRQSSTSDKVRTIFRLRISEFIRSLKNGKSCVDCQEQHPYWRLYFDHRENKSINISLISSRKHWCDKRILQEIAKCDLVCANCHRLRTISKGQHLSKLSSSFEGLVCAST